MFILQHTAAPTPRYQATRGWHLAARPISLLQQFLLACCDGRMVTLADLVKATRQTAEEVSEALNFLRVHGLVRVVAPRL